MQLHAWGLRSEQAADGLAWGTVHMSKLLQKCTFFSRPLNCCTYLLPSRPPSMPYYPFRDIQNYSLLPDSFTSLPLCFHRLNVMPGPGVMQETRYRQRYLDGIVNPFVHDIFATRSRIIEYVRRFLIDRHFIEVSSPAGSCSPPAGSYNPCFAAQLCGRTGLAAARSRPAAARPLLRPIRPNRRQ